MSGYALLLLAAVSYAVGIVAQTVAARRTEARARIDPGLLVRLTTDRLFLAGFCAQVAGFILSYLARASLPLYLVQAAAAAAVGLATLAGVVLLGWTVRCIEIALLVLLFAGLVLLVHGAQPSAARDLSTPALVVLVGILILTLALALPATRLRGTRGAVALGALAGVAFAVLAAACRPIADDSLVAQLVSPSAWVTVVAALIGQTLMAAGLQRGSATATAASMDATSTVLAAVVGLSLLGDSITDGRLWAVVGGLALVVAAIAGLAGGAAAEPEELGGDAPQPPVQRTADHRA